MSTPTANAPIVDGHGNDDAGSQTPIAAAQPAIEAELLIEEISIDGMCGVY